MLVTLLIEYIKRMVLENAFHINDITSQEYQIRAMKRVCNKI